MIKKVDREAQQHKDTQALGSEDLQERAYIWADDPWADEEKSRATSSGDRTKNVKKSSDMIVGWGSGAGVGLKLFSFPGNSGELSLFSLF
jgi:hypothetical protein